MVAVGAAGGGGWCWWGWWSAGAFSLPANSNAVQGNALQRSQPPGSSVVGTGVSREHSGHSGTTFLLASLKWGPAKPKVLTFTFPHSESTTDRMGVQERGKARERIRSYV